MMMMQLTDILSINDNKPGSIRKRNRSDCGEARAVLAKVVKNSEITVLSTGQYKGRYLRRQQKEDKFDNHRNHWIRYLQQRRYISNVIL
jgi:hypothetical protein